jgi:hypothetical protein
MRNPGNANHKVPSTSNTIPFSIGLSSNTIPVRSPNGANRLGSLESGVVILKRLLEHAWKTLIGPERIVELLKMGNLDRYFM